MAASSGQPIWLENFDDDTRNNMIFLITSTTNDCHLPVDEELMCTLEDRFNLLSDQVNELYEYLRGKFADSDRVVKEVSKQPINPLPSELLFIDDDKIDLTILRNHLEKEGRILESDIVRLCRCFADIMRGEKNCLELEEPLTVAGDIHGQFFDLLHLFEIGGEILDDNDNNYLFLGDYVDRGCFSCEVVIYLFALKVNYPNRIHMLRGNHECRHLSKFFNFHEECCYKYSQDVYDEIMDAFDCLALAATVSGNFFCIHGGLSPEIKTIADLEKIDRFQEVPKTGPMCDLLWSDPTDEDAEEQWFSYNDTRRCAHKFGRRAANFFVKKNKLTAIIRGHEVFNEGYKMHWVRKVEPLPLVFTIFSAPNYCDVYRNKGAILTIANNSLNVRQFVWKSHPYYLPNFIDVFAWSLPFVAEKVTEMLSSVVGRASEALVTNESKVAVSAEAMNEEEAGDLKAKVLNVAKIVKYFNTIRGHQEEVNELQQLNPSQANTHPKVRKTAVESSAAALFQRQNVTSAPFQHVAGSPTLMAASPSTPGIIPPGINGFREAKEIDYVNEILPGSELENFEASRRRASSLYSGLDESEQQDIANALEDMNSLGSNGPSQIVLTPVGYDEEPLTYVDTSEEEEEDLAGMTEETVLPEIKPVAQEAEEVTSPIAGKLVEASRKLVDYLKKNKKN